MIRVAFVFVAYGLLAGCAQSVTGMTPGFVPRDGNGQPVFSAIGKGHS